jgi:Ca2+-binding RTX toxin-like protein
LIGFQGADTMNGGPGNDTMIWNPGDGSDQAIGGSGDDTVIVNGGGVSETFTISATATGAIFNRVTPGPFFVNIISPTEKLILNASGGGDVVTGTTGLNGVIALTVNGGDGNDLIRGGDGPDTLNGDNGNDSLTGFRGADTKNGGPGNDTMIWNNGDGSDIMAGGDGDDLVVVNGAAVSETFTITPSGQVAVAAPNATAVGSVFFQRVAPGPFSLDIEAEGVQVNGFDGDDTFTVTPLANTDVHFNGGGQTIADILRVNAQSRTVDVLSGKVDVSGTQPVTHQGVEIVQIINADSQLLLPVIATWRGQNP